MLYLTFQGPGDQRLRHNPGKKLVYLVGIVVDSRYQVSCLILVKEIEWQFLQFIEYRIPQTEKHSLSYSTHQAHLNIVDNKCSNKHGQQNPGK